MKLISSILSPEYPSAMSLIDPSLEADFPDNAEIFGVAIYNPMDMPLLDLLNVTRLELIEHSALMMKSRTSDIFLHATSYVLVACFAGSVKLLSDSITA